MAYTTKQYVLNKELKKVVWIYSNPLIYNAVGSKKKGDLNRMTT